MQKLRGNLFLIVFLMSFFIELWIHELYEESKRYRLNNETVQDSGFRSQILNEEMLQYIKKKPAQAGKLAGLYLLESKFSYQGFHKPYSKITFETQERKWKKQPEWEEYLYYSNAIWNDLKYFPVPDSTLDSSLTTSYTDGWMTERTYGGTRGHEGIDIMAGRNEPGLYPVVTMTDGVILSKGWLEKGGYRLLIKAPGGACFYYAHLDSYADVEEGDQISAGDVIGFMGDTGYGKQEGTRGQFPVHLHVGCYIYPDGKETSVNAYWPLRYLEKSKLKCAYS